MSLTGRIIVSIFAVALFTTRAAHADDRTDKQRTVSTTGQATVYVVPDELTISVGVQTFNASLDESKSANDKASRSLLKAIREAGVEDKNVQADTVYVELVYRDRRVGDKALDVEGYVSRRQYTITLKEPKKVDVVVDAALKNGANQLLGIEYRDQQVRKHRDEARKMAIKAAKEKAQLLAGELDEKVGRARKIDEDSSENSFRVGNMNFTQNASAAGDREGDEGETTTPLGQIAIRATVSVTFDLAD